MGDLVIAVPMLGRPHLVAPLVASIRATCEARIVFACTPGDTAAIHAVDASGCERLMVDRQPVGDFARKINTVYRATVEPYIFVGASDLEFRPGWYEAALAALTPGIGVVGTNDLCNPRVIAGEHATHFLVTRAYADEFGTIDGPGAVLFEGYRHEFVDDECVGTAKMRQAYATALTSHVRHLHPDCSDTPRDPLYAQQGARMRASRYLYLTRRRRWTR